MGIRRASSASAFGLATARLFVWPAQGAPARVDAIVMLAGTGDRLDMALQLAREHQAPVLVVSRGRDGYDGPCPPVMPGVQTICFDPNPATPAGKSSSSADSRSSTAGAQLVLVTTRVQDTRARITDGALFRWLDLRDHGITAFGEVALSDRL